MIKKAIAYDVISQFVEDNDIDTPQKLVDKGQELYELLTNHEHFGNILGEHLKYPDFMKAMEEGFRFAQLQTSARFVHVRR